MPLYEYECPVHGRFEVHQRITEDALKKCNVGACRKPVKKLISNTSFALKGSGWYATDYATGSSKTKDDAKSDKVETKSDKKSDKAETKSDKTSDKTETKADKTSDKKSDKTETKPESKLPQGGRGKSERGSAAAA